jgi:hypothetical protein
MAALAAEGMPAKAEAAFRQVLDAAQRILRPDHPNTLITRNNLAGLLTAQNKSAEAEAELHLILKAQMRVPGSDRPSTLATRGPLDRLKRTSA